MFNRTKRKIDFLIGGTQKGGTTVMDYYLRKHPEIGMGLHKELHFFDKEKFFLPKKIEYLKYESLFYTSPQKKKLGEATPIYLYWESSCSRIWEYNPDMKLIFILRNPITRAFSHWNMEYDRKSDLENFSIAIRKEKSRIKESLPFQNRSYSYIDRGYYSEQIRRFKRFFPDDHLKFIKYEEFNINQEEILKEVFEFLDVDPSRFIFERKTIHKQKKHAIMSIEDKEYLLDKFKNEIYQVEHMLNWDCSDWLE